MPIAECEIEAESVAWLVSTRNGVIPRSAPYMAEYIRDVDLERISVYAIFEAANRVESRTVRKKGEAPK